MKWISLFILFLGFQSFAGGEVGGNGDGISAFFVRAAYVLQAKMAAKEAEGVIYLEEFKAATFKSVLKTPVEVVGKDREEILRGPDGRLKDVKVIFDPSKKNPRILLREAVWEKYLNQHKPDYRMVLHGYIYAANLDDSIYQYSSLVPLESMGLPEVLPDEPSFHEFTTRFPMQVVKKTQQGYIGVSLDRSKVAGFNLRGSLVWQFTKAGRSFVDISDNRSDGYTILAYSTGKGEIIRLSKLGIEKFAKDFDEPNVPLAIEVDTYLTERTVARYGHNVFSAEEGVVWRGWTGEASYAYGYKLVESTKRPYFTNFYKFHKSLEIEGEFTSGFRTQKAIWLGGYSEKVKKPFILSVRLSEYPELPRFGKPIFLNFNNAKISSIVGINERIWIIANDGKSSALFYYDNRRDEVSFSRKFPGEIIYVVENPKDGNHLVVASNKNLRKFTPSYSWRKSYVVKEGYDDCKRFWNLEAKNDEAQCAAEKGVFNTTCSDFLGSSSMGPYPGALMVRCDQPDSQTPVLSYEMLNGTWWSSFASLTNYKKKQISATSQFEFVIQGDKFWFEGGICQQAEGCLSKPHPQSNILTASGTIKNGRVWLECGHSTHEAGGIQDNVLTLWLPNTHGTCGSTLLTAKLSPNKNTLDVRMAVGVEAFAISERDVLGGI